MKFQTEKKSTLCIYTEEPLTGDKMEREVSALRQELDVTRRALRTQTARCRKLVAAFTARLRQKEHEERQGRELRDQQLSTVLRALLVLEARLRKEQREIQRQLQERDAVIRSQTLEIARLRRAARSDSPRKTHRSEQPTVADLEYGVQHIIRKLESNGKCDENDTKQTLRRPVSADFGMIQNSLNLQTKNCSVTKSLENLDSYNFSRQKTLKNRSEHEAEPKRSHGSLESLLQDNMDSETSEATVVEIRVVEENNQRNACDPGKKMSKQQVLKPSVSAVTNNEDFVTKLECETTYGMEPVLDSDSGVFQGSSSEVSDSSLKSDCQDDDLPNRDLYKDYQHNPVLECVSQILLRDEDDMYRPLPDDSDRIEDMKKGRFNNLWPSIKEEQESQTEEEDNNDTTVIHSTNKVQEKIKEDIQTPLQVKITDNVSETKGEQKKSSLKDKTPSPPIKAQHLQEKACLLMSNQRLTLVRNPDLEEVDKKEENESRLKITYQKAKTPGVSSQIRSSVPPALPPKPPQLGSLSRLRHKRNIFNPQSIPSQNPHLINSNETNSVNVSSTESNRDSTENGFDSLKKVKPPKPLDIHMNYSHPIYQEKPRQRQILSNGSLKRALNHEPQDGRQYSIEQQENSTSKTLEEKLDELNLSAYRHPVKVVGPVAARVQRQLESRHEPGRHQYLQDGMVEEKPASNSHGTIRVGCSVSSLITGSTGGSIVTELTQGNSCQAEERIEDNDGDEDGNATLRSNFEEFRLEDVDMDSVEEVGRPAGDGAECRASQPSQSTSGSYEHFLEATGLSQKSIMTPSRMLSNHRNVMKPKDVKHRSRVLRAAASTVSSGPIVKYWIEPFL